jgi:hypothetical protein
MFLSPYRVRYTASTVSPEPHSYRAISGHSLDTVVSRSGYYPVPDAVVITSQCA